MAKPYAISSKPDKKWQAQCDMRTLIDAKAIQSDAARMRQAQAAAQEEAKKAAAVAKTLSTKAPKKKGGK